MFDKIKGKLLGVGTTVGVVVGMSIPTFAAEGAAGVTNLSTIVTADTISGVFDQVYGILPVLLPAIIGFIALRKGWSFLKGEIYSA